MSRNSGPRNIYIYRKQRRVVTLGTAWVGKTTLAVKIYTMEHRDRRKAVATSM